MGLSLYKQKRHFKQTPEPAGRVKQTTNKKLEFVIQKHHASHLHYDFRLELDGVLKSWAVPKGPSMNPADKRLAMMVEDHPFEYRKFEGVIPEGNYGAGNVIIWDKGTYELDRQAENWPKTLQEGLKKGDLKFILHGEKLHGSFALIKTPHMGDNAWLLIKHKDKSASKKDITKQEKSVVSGKKVDELSNGKIFNKHSLDSYPKSKMPTAVKPMLATLVKEPFDGKDWIYEIKWDGYRAIGTTDGKKVELYSRNGNDFRTKYGPVVESLRNLNHKVVLDGEIVSVDKDGHSHFEWLQNWGRSQEGTLLYYAFDILWCDGQDLTNAPLLERKKILKSVLSSSDGAIRYSDHIAESGKQFFATAQRQKLEGVMAKAVTSTYEAGKRSQQWLKIKTHLRQEVVIGGFTEPKGSRKEIGALILGIYDGENLVYVGHTGGGIPTDMLKPLRTRLEKLERKTSPFSDKFKPNSTPHWVKPELICEVSFSEWTADGHMRQPIFIGMREDKSTPEVHRELAKKPPLKQEASNKPKTDCGKLELRHLDKIFFPRTRYTKGDLVDYYKTVSPIMLPYLMDRPHNLLRQPNGINGDSFFQKDMNHASPDWITTKAIYSESNQKNINYMVCDGLESLLYMVQLGCIEINPWNSRVKSLKKPDWLVIDLDPEKIGFDKVIEAARVVHEVMDKLEIPSYPKTSGKTGIHIFVPLAAKYTHDQSKQLAQVIATMVNEQLPNITSLERSPSKRQKKVYVDFLQNREGQTLAAPYSVRPIESANVSMPLEWGEVTKRLKPENFTIKNALKRLDKKGDLWRPVLGDGIDIKKILANLS